MLFTERGEFSRTPKFAVRDPGDRWEVSRYALSGDPWAWGEACLGVLVCGAILASGERWGHSAWLAIYALGYLYVAGVSIWQCAQRAAAIKLRD